MLTFKTTDLRLFWTAYDPLDLASGSADVLGFRAGHIALADSLLPGFTTATTAPRYLAMLCAAVVAAEKAVPGEGVATAQVRQDRLAAVKSYERAWALACGLAADEGGVGDEAVDGARPDERQLLAYFHGRIDEDDLLAQLEHRARQAERIEQGANEGPSKDLRNYLIREFVEMLYGLEGRLETALYAPRALEAALLGESSPAALAERALMALRSGRRSPTAAAFQFAELVRVVAGLSTGIDGADQAAIADVLRRAVDRLLGFVGQAARMPTFARSLRDPDFAAYARATLPLSLARRFLGAAGDERTPIEGLSRWAKTTSPRS